MSAAETYETTAVGQKDRLLQSYDDDEKGHPNEPGTSDDHMF